ncbi:lipase family protein [Gordonia sp. (in: high G+C Gram-positive bacteria)]|uniref:lipase family protein n=1 Tax=Gordonia sp. (in: high G+C Gram-positive bacteria) TaxID=84139 RepID=UPI001699753F|nr:lipase family protein [Gordonia sp. (in: high G+C Gram-positive bacteria)]NLG46480.1 lipase [Gordonia sp. (in: high G+C Gram-positive bacteria)]
MRNIRGFVSFRHQSFVGIGKKAAAVTVAGAVVGSGLVIAPGAADAAGNFYTPPATVSDHPGTVLKKQSTELLLQIPGIRGQWPGTATKIMYSSTKQDGKPTAVTGTVVEPTAPWKGKGPRPTVVLAPGTVGQGDQCAGSKMLAFPLAIDPTKPSMGVNYSGLEMNLFLLNGVRVVMTDYIGMGTPGIHTYVNRVESGHAVLDAARAGLKAVGAPKDAPVAFSGYSQGGGSAASAAELASTYAADLNVKATYAGAPPADLSKVINQIDGTFITGAIGYAINGLAARYPELDPILKKETNAHGKQLLRRVATECIGDTGLSHGFQRSSSWTRSGKSLAAVIKQYPEIQKMIDEQRIGRLKPNAPVLISTGVSDDVIPHGQAVQLYRDWKKQGAPVTLANDYVPPIFPGLVVNHALPMLTQLLPGTTFILTEFNR